MNIVVPDHVIKELLEAIDESQSNIRLANAKHALEETAREVSEYKGYGWIAVKSYMMNTEKTWEDRYRDLTNHHIEETTFLIDELRKIGN